MDKQSDSFLSIYYKPPQVLRKDEDVGNMPHGRTPGKIGKKNKPNMDGETNSPKIPIFNSYGIIGGSFLLPPQGYGSNDIIGHKFILVPQ